METNDIYGQSLQILSITEEQAGIYTCRLDDSDERNISVNVNSKCLTLKLVVALYDMMSVDFQHMQITVCLNICRPTCL